MSQGCTTEAGAVNAPALMPKPVFWNNADSLPEAFPLYASGPTNTGPARSGRIDIPGISS